MKNNLFDRFKIWFPPTAEKTVEYETEDDMVIAKLNDGMTVLYDDMFNSYSVIKRGEDDLTEIQSRNEFSRRLYRKMIRKGISQKELSELTGISEVMLSRYLNKKASPTLQVIYKIAKVLNCPANELIYVDYRKD